jgi:hypothetical protein
MGRKDIIIIKQKELRRLHVIHRILEEKITQVKASEMLSLSERQVRRIAKRIGQEGDIGIVHKSRGKESKRKLPEKLMERVVYLYQRSDSYSVIATSKCPLAHTKAGGPPQSGALGKPP